jgi:TRAP-type mannitol/chloroaromatic compound transport system substrate-binding protein
MHGFRLFKAALSTVLIASFILLQGCINKAPEKYTWQLQSQANQGTLDFNELKSFADSVKQMSAGRLDITIHPSSSITSGADIYSAVQEGRIQMGNGWPNWWSGKNPAWALLNAGPFDFMNLDASMMFFMAGEGTKLANSLSAPHGILWRPAWWPGMEFGLLSTSPIKGLADLEKKKVRIGPGLPSEVLAAASQAYTIPLLPEEIKSALQSGDIDAVEWTTATGAWDLGLDGISKHAIVPAVWQPSVLSDFLINKEAYDALPKDLQAILESAIKAFTLTTTLKAKVSDFEALDKFFASGTQINKWSDEDIQKWREVTEQVMKSYSEKSLINKSIIEHKAKFKETYNEYYRWFGSYE